MCCQLALPWTQAPIHHPPLGGCNGDLICFICPMISEPFTSVSNLLRSCQAKGEMNDKKNPRQARGTSYQDGAQFCSSSGNIQPLCLQFLPPNSPPPAPLFLPFYDPTQSSQVGRPRVENGRPPFPLPFWGWLLPTPPLCPVPTPSHLLLLQARLLNLQFPRNFMNARHKPK